MRSNARTKIDDIGDLLRDINVDFDAVLEIVEGWKLPAFKIEIHLCLIIVKYLY